MKLKFLLLLSAVLFAAGMPAPIHAAKAGVRTLESFKPMSSEMLADIIEVLRPSDSKLDVIGDQYSTLYSFTGLNSESEKDRKIAGALNETIGGSESEFAAHLELAAKSKSKEDRAMILEGLLMKYADAARQVEPAMQAEEAELESKVQHEKPKDVWHMAYSQAHRLERWSVYGTGTAESIRRMRNIAGEAEKAFANQEAEKLGPNPSKSRLVVANVKQTLKSVLTHPALPPVTKVEVELALAVSKAGLDFQEWQKPGDEAGVGEFVNRQRAELNPPLKPSVDYNFGSDMFVNKFGPGKGGRLFILRDSRGKVAGTAAFAAYPYDDGTFTDTNRTNKTVLHRACELEMVFLDPAFRHKGIGPKLMFKLMADASRGGYRVAELGTRKESMAAAMNIWIKLGWVPSADVNASTVPHFYRDHEYGYFARDIRPDTLQKDFPREFADPPTD